MVQHPITPTGVPRHLSTFSFMNLCENFALYICVSNSVNPPPPIDSTTPHAVSRVSQGNAEFLHSGLAQFSESPPPGSPLYMWILKEERSALWNLPLENLLLENLPLENLVAKRRRWKQHEQVCSQRCLTIAGAPPTDHLLGCNWFRTRWPAHIWTHIFSIVLYYCNTVVWL